MTEHVWASNEGRRFIITEQVFIDGKLWIYYQRQDNHDLKYHCLADAFYERFTKEPR